MGRHLKEQVEHFKNYDFGYGKYRLGEAKVIRLGITQEQISEHKIVLKPDKAIFDKLFGTSMEAGDDGDKPGDSRTAAFIRKYESLMSSGDRLPPLAELAALFANDRLIDFTQHNEAVDYTQRDTVQRFAPVQGCEQSSIECTSACHFSIESLVQRYVLNVDRQSIRFA